MVKGSKITEETRENMRKAKLGKKRGCYGSIERLVERRAELAAKIFRINDALKKLGYK